MNPVLRIVVVVCGLIAIVGGIMQMKKGFGEMKMDPEVERLSKESDESFTAANKQLAEAGTLFQSVLDAVDKDGLPAVRTQKRESVEKAATLYEEASQKLRQAAQKADDAAAKKPGEKLEEFLKTKAGAYREFAAAREINRDIARMILDETIKTGEELVAKVTDPAARRDKLEASATEAAARADKLVQDSKK